MEKGLLHKQIMDFFVRNFDVRQEKEDELETIESIKKGIEFKGTNLWVLIFATFVASLGLNTNSTAVIIGAMLISPLMGPIMGFGLGLGISDFDLIKRSFRQILPRLRSSATRQIKQQILSGALHPGDALPSIRLFSQGAAHQRHHNEARV